MTIDELRTLRGLSMTKLCDAAGLSMGAIFRLTRPGADITGARLETLMKLAAGLDAVITIDPEGVTIAVCLRVEATLRSALYLSQKVRQGRYRQILPLVLMVMRHMILSLDRPVFLAPAWPLAVSQTTE